MGNESLKKTGSSHRQKPTRQPEGLSMPAVPEDVGERVPHMNTAPQSFTPSHVMQLQRSIGNQATVRLLNNTPLVQRQAQSDKPPVEVAKSTNAPIIQAKMVDDEGAVLDVDLKNAESLEALAQKLGDEYKGKLKDSLAEKKIHEHDLAKDKAARNRLLQKHGLTYIQIIDRLKEPDAKKKPKPPFYEYNPLKRALDKNNPMIFTIQDIKDYLDGKPVPGISDLGPDDIKGQNDEVLPISAGKEEQWEKSDFEALNLEERARERARTIKATIERMKANRADYDERTEDIKPDGTLPEDADDNIKTLAERFKETIFFYGTTGELATNKTKFKNLFAKVQKIKRKRLGGNASAYSAGIRNMGFMRAMSNGDNAQMMDMYYGSQDLETWHMMADPIIGEYVHNMMGYAGEYRHSENMDTSFRKNFPLGGGENQNQGWSVYSKPAGMPEPTDTLTPEKEALKEAPPRWDPNTTATMEISRIIREGVRKFGGTIVFEGAEVTNQSHFVEAKHGDRRDTNMEASELLPEFAKHPQKSSVPYGAGQLVFYWQGKETPPSRQRFLSHWAYGKRGKEYPGDKTVKYTNTNGELCTDVPVAWFWDFPSVDKDTQDEVIKKFGEVEVLEAWKARAITRGTPEAEENTQT